MPPRMKIFGLLGLFLLTAVPSGATKLDDAINASVLAQKSSAKTQKSIDKVSDETSVLLERYQMTMSQVDSLQAYNAQLQELLTSQVGELSSLEGQIEGVTTTSREMVPLMQDMLGALEQFITLDVPFLQSERSQRLKQLQKMMSRADVTHSEKFRRILEAYQIENEYGRKIDSYQAIIPLEGQQREVDILRVGRLVMVCQTKDTTLSARWNEANESWDLLDNVTYRNAIRGGIKMAKKQASIDILTLPITAPEAVK